MAAPVKLQRATTSINHPKSSVAPRLGKFFSLSFYFAHNTNERAFGRNLAAKPHRLYVNNAYYRIAMILRQHDYIILLNFLQDIFAVVSLELS
jgi:hypothetical protein